jgi:hypothetical protein
VLISYSSSDHWSIDIQYFDHSPGINHRTYWSLKNPNWDLYSQLIEHDLSNTPLDINPCDSQDKIDSIVKKFMETILSATYKSIGLKTNQNPRKKNVSWWNKDCHDAIKNYKKRLNRYKKPKLLKTTYS